MHSYQVDPSGRPHMYGAPLKTFCAVERIAISRVSYFQAPHYMLATARILLRTVASQRRGYM